MALHLADRHAEIDRHVLVPQVGKPKSERFETSRNSGLSRKRVLRLAGAHDAGTLALMLAQEGLARRGQARRRTRFPASAIDLNRMRCAISASLDARPVPAAPPRGRPAPPPLQRRVAERQQLAHRAEVPLLLRQAQRVEDQRRAAGIAPIPSSDRLPHPCLRAGSATALILSTSSTR